MAELDAGALLALDDTGAHCHLGLIIFTRFILLCPHNRMSLRSKLPEFALARQFCRGSGFRHDSAGGRVAYARPRPGRGGRWVLARGRGFVVFQFV